VTGAVQKPGEYTLAQIQALPKCTQNTRHVCIEGWDVIGRFGVILSLRRRSVCNFLLIRKSHIASVSYRLERGPIMPGGLWTPPRPPLLLEQPTIEIGDKIRNLSLCGLSKCTQLSSAQEIRKLCNLFSGESLSFTRGA
jgi:hypothetical protein